jgi:hypothetical protein
MTIGPGLDRLSFLCGEQLDYADDDHLRSKGDNWKFTNSSLDQYDLDAGMDGLLIRVIGSCIGQHSQRAGLEIAAGADGIALQQLLRLGLLEHALMTNYTDMRSTDTQELDSLDQVTGNILDPEVWAQVVAWQKEHAPDGLSYVAHRPGRILQNQSAQFYGGATQLLLDIMRPGSVLFTQIPTSLVDSQEGRAELRQLCQVIRSRDDVVAVHIFPQHNEVVGYREVGHALIIKAGDIEPSTSYCPV